MYRSFNYVIKIKITKYNILILYIIRNNLKPTESHLRMHVIYFNYTSYLKINKTNNVIIIISDVNVQSGI